MKPPALACKGCGATYPLDALFACDRCFGPLEVGYDESRRPQRRRASRSRPGRATLWRYADFLPVAPPAHGLPVGRSPLIRADRLAARAGPATASCTSRPRRRTRPTRSRTGWSRSPPPRRSSSGYRGAGLRLHRQPGRGHRRRRRRARPADVHLRARRPRAREDHRRRGLRRHGVRGRRHLRRRQPAVLGAGLRPAVGVREREHARRTTPRARRRSRSRRPSSSAGGRPTGWSRRSPPGSLYTKILRGLRAGPRRRPGRAGPQAPVMHGAQGAGCAPVATAFAVGRRRRAAGAADRYRQVACDRQPGRRRLRARRRPAHGRQHRGGRRRRDRRGHPAAGAGRPASSPRPPAASPTAVLREARRARRDRCRARRWSPTSPATA